MSGKSTLVSMKPAGKVIATFESGQFMVDPGLRGSRVSTGVHVYTQPPETSASELAEALEECLNYIENTEAELGITLDSGDKARAALAKAKGEGA